MVLATCTLDKNILLLAWKPSYIVNKMYTYVFITTIKPSQIKLKQCCI